MTQFDLEQQILNCWNILDDLKAMTAMGRLTNENVEALGKVYEIKFEQTFNTFEEHLQEVFKEKKVNES